jgi:hypothetical protein
MNPADDSAASEQSRGFASAPPDDATVISGGLVGGSGSSISRPAPASAAGRAPTAEIGRLLEGTMLGPYRLDEFVGGGGMGAVFRALDTTLDRTVAVKVLARRESDDEETLRRFRNEAQSAARLDHENIGRVHAVGSEADWHYIVFEFIEGTNIRDLVREQGAFDPARTIDVAIQVADALEHASEREIVHRDIKPSNIVITPAGRARIVDMGLARLHQVEGDADLTVSGMTLGTFDYISPEQARDPRAADVRSDLYSLGCTIFYMLTGRPPFAEGTLVQKLLQHQQTPPPAIEDLRFDVPKRLAAIVARLMEKDPLDRYQRPAVLVADLLACAEAEGYPLAASRSAAVVVAAEPRQESRLPWLVPAVALLALVAGLWLRSTAERRGFGPVAAVGDLALPEANPSSGRSDTTQAAVRRTTTADEFAAAVAGGGDNEIVEVDGDGILEVPAFRVVGRRLTLRAAGGRQPVVRITPGPDGSGVTLAGGHLVVQGLVFQLADQPPAAGGESAGRRSLLTLSGGSLNCESVVLQMPGDPEGAAGTAPAAFVTILAAAAADIEVRLAGVRAAGDADLLAVAASGGGRIQVRWQGGELVTPRHLMALEGARAPVTVACDLSNVVAACGTGIMVSRDSVALPRPVRLSLRAESCRFAVTDPSRPFLEWSGIGTPAEYATAADWQDRGGRYEGGAVFKRIDGAAERVEQSFGDPGVPPAHDPVVGSLPRPADWAGWGL